MKKGEKKSLEGEAVRTKFAYEQTNMACKRSLLSYVRTACVFVSLAFTYLKIASNDNFDPFVIVMFIIGAIFMVIGVIEYFIVRNRSKKMYQDFKAVMLNIDHDED